jgi:hypothetical protein
MGRKEIIDGFLNFQRNWSLHDHDCPFKGKVPDYISDIYSKDMYQFYRVKCGRIILEHFFHPQILERFRFVDTREVPYDPKIYDPLGNRASVRKSFYLIEKLVNKILSCELLDERENKILTLRYKEGKKVERKIKGGKIKIVETTRTDEEIGEIIGLSRERVNTIRTNAEKKLIKYYERKMHN